MNTHIPAEQRLRISTNNNRVFADASAAPFEECLTVEFYQQHRLELREKLNVFKMFVFIKEQNVSEFDYGWWSDAIVIWVSEYCG